MAVSALFANEPRRNQPDTMHWTTWLLCLGSRWYPGDKGATWSDMLRQEATWWSDFDPMAGK